MKTIAVIQADLDVTSIGTRSRLADDWDGGPVLRRTAERLARVDGLDGIHVLCPQPQYAACRELLDGAAVEIRALDAPPPPWLPLVQAARKWSLDGWRGGLGGTTGFDEFTDPCVLDALLESVSADAVLSVPPAAPLLDPHSLSALIRQAERTAEESKLTFSQAPPGLCGVVLRAELIHELATSRIPVGWVLSYKPDRPQKDLVFQPCCLEVAAPVRYAVGRMVADTRRSIERMSECRRRGAGTAEEIGTFLLENERTAVDPLPREVEIELTTEDPLPQTTIRPRGDRVPRRGPIHIETVHRVAATLRDYDDSLVVLGGFGDPLCHPRFADILQLLRGHGNDATGVYGVCVRTTGIHLDDRMIHTLIDNEVDVVTLTLDAWTPTLYERLHRPRKQSIPDSANHAEPGLERVIERVDQLETIRRRLGTVKPLVVPEFTKCRRNVHEMDAFFDGWMRKVGAAVITGPSHYAGQFPNDRVTTMAPPEREACRRIRSRCLILADGHLTLCDQDVAGRHAVGDLGSASLVDLWCGSRFERIREAHRSRAFDASSLCAACDEWHRP